MRISDWSSDVCSSDLVETRVLLRLGVEPFFLAAQVVVPVAWPAGHLAAVDLDDARGQRAQEAAVMGDEHERAGPALEEALEPVDRGDVEVVGRLVEQQHVRRRHQRARQQHARSEEHTSELQSLMRTSYAVFRFKNKKPDNKR